MLTIGQALLFREEVSQQWVIYLGWYDDDLKPIFKKKLMMVPGDSPICTSYLRSDNKSRLLPRK